MDAAISLVGAQASGETRDILRIEAMKQDEKPATSPASPSKADAVGKPAAMSHAQDAPASDNDLDQGIDRPGADLGGASGDTDAGSGLGLGQDAFDTPGERRLPGRRLDSDLTKPRWGGPAPRDTAVSDAKTADPETPSTPETEKPR
jgi:hypothetical protein